MILMDLPGPATVGLTVNIVVALALIGFVLVTLYLKYRKQSASVQQACKYFRDIVNILDGVPSVSPTVLSWCREALKSICTGSPLPEPLPDVVHVDPEGVSWIYSGVNKVALVNEAAWRRGGGRVVVDGGHDEPSFFSWAYLDRSRVTHDVYVHYDLQGYFDLKTNTIHSLVENPFDYETGAV